MTQLRPDAVIKVRFKTTDEGGRKGAPFGEQYGCVLLVDSDAFECRLLLGGRTLALGVEHEVPVKFLSPAIVLPRLSPGVEVRIWEGRDIAKGTILRLV